MYVKKRFTEPCSRAKILGDNLYHTEQQIGMNYENEIYDNSAINHDGSNNDANDGIR